MDPHEALCMVLACTLKSKVKKRVQQCVTDGVCLCCESKAAKRGLCQKHYDSWIYHRRPLSKVARIKYDRDLIIQGKLLEAHGAAEYRGGDIFARKAKEAS